MPMRSYSVPMKMLMIFLLFIQVAQSADTLVFSEKVKRSHKKAIKNDLKWFKSLKFKNQADPRTLAILELESLNRQTLEKWLFERVQYIFDRKELTEFDLNRRLEVERPLYEYPFGDVFPSEILGNNYIDSRSNGTVMTNVGTGLYLSGKIEQTLLSLKMKDDQKNERKIIINTPRQGLVRLGKAFWLGASHRERENVEYKALRMANLFHEARHSDGHGESLGFLHSICPEGHDFEGERACDSSTNGPYSVDAYLTYEMAFNCNECDIEVREILKIRVLDSLSRVISDGDFEDNFWPAAAEGKRQ